MRRIAFHTLGCKVNQYDTQAMLESFQAAGWQVCEFGEDADAYLINTCTVTGTGDRKSLRLIRHVHGEHPQAAIIVTGCLAQRVPEQVALPGVKLVLGTAKRAQVVELLERALQGDGCLIEVNPLKGAVFEPLTVNSHEGHTRATMKIQEGCDRYCAYCIIPTVRGPVRSMPLEDVRAEARRLTEAGYPEIVLTGIHLASYGRGTGDTLLNAIRAVAESVPRVRLGSLEPVAVTDEFARGVAELGRVMPQFHLSMQSGSAGVLARMRRRYTPEEYMRAVERLRQHLPGCAITTDVLTGFPGETEQEAQETLDFVRAVGFARIHVFPYSRRKGTAADAMPDQVPESVKHERAAKLLALGNQLEENYVSTLVGTVQDVLFETAAGEAEAEGYTGQYVRVRAKARPGQLCRVRICAREGTLARGELLH